MFQLRSLPNEEDKKKSHFTSWSLTYHCVGAWAAQEAPGGVVSERASLEFSRARRSRDVRTRSETCQARHVWGDGRGHGCRLDIGCAAGLAGARGCRGFPACVCCGWDSCWFGSPVS